MARMLQWEQVVMTKPFGARTATLSVRGFTLIELLIVVALIGILSAIAAPLLIAAKSSANEASAVQTLRTLVSAQSTFSNVCGNGAYTTSLTMLVTERVCVAGPGHHAEERVLLSTGGRTGVQGCRRRLHRAAHTYRASTSAPNRSLPTPADAGLPPITSARSGRTPAASRRPSRSSQPRRSRPSIDPQGHAAIRPGRGPSWRPEARVTAC